MIYLVNRKLQRCVPVFLLLVFAAFFLVLRPIPVHADEAHNDVAGSGETASSKTVGRYGMTPIRGADVKDGTYDIDMDVSSRFFRIDSCTLTVKDGNMTASVRLDSFSYSLIYIGTGVEAAAAASSDYIEVTEDADGYAVFTMPAEALDQQIRIASFSIRKNKWYDRTILFDATSLPEGSLRVKLPDFDAIGKGLAAAGYDTDGLDASNDLSGAESQSSSAPAAADSGEGKTGLVESDSAVPLDQKDGEYSIEVNMTGGSGRAGVTSPAPLIVRNGKAYAKLCWSSSYYDYMIVDGVKYRNNTTDGGASTFLIPVLAMDEPFSVTADTTAMGDPVEIVYELTFYRDTIGSRNLVPQIAARRVLILAALIIAAGGVLSLLTRKCRYR